MEKGRKDMVARKWDSEENPKSRQEIRCPKALLFLRKIMQERRAEVLQQPD
jgi:hypothetical protein